MAIIRKTIVVVGNKKTLNTSPEDQVNFPNYNLFLTLLKTIEFWFNHIT